MKEKYIGYFYLKIYQRFLSDKKEVYDIGDVNEILGTMRIKKEDIKLILIEMERMNLIKRVGKGYPMGSKVKILDNNIKKIISSYNTITNYINSN